MTITRDLIATAFPGQPRMQAAFEALVNDAETATSNLNTALAAISGLSGGAEGFITALAAKQARNDTLDAISILGPDPGVLEQIQAGIFAIRPIDAADVKSLMTRELADTRYLGGAHAAASATKLATARTIAASGDGTWSVSFDGSANVSAALTLATVNANTGTFGGAKTSVQVSLDGKGRVTSASAVTITPDYSSIGIVPTSRFLGRITAGTGSAEALTGTQATSLLDTFTSALKGLVPASGGGTVNFLRADGTWAAAGAPTGAALTKTDDTNVTLTLGGTPTSALLQAVSITVGWTSTLAVGRGGTGVTTSTGSGSNVLSASPTFSGTAAFAGLSTTTDINCGGAFRSTGVSATGWAGPGFEAYYYSPLTRCEFNSYNRTSNTWMPLVLGCSKAQFSQIGTTASAANAFLDSTDTNSLLRSTSSRRYKRDIEDADPALADQVLALRPVWYRSKAPRDNADWGWWGLIAEEVADIDPRLVQWGYWPEDYDRRFKTEQRLKKTAKLRPDAVQYDRLAVLLLSVIQRQEERLKALEAKA